MIGGPAEDMPGREPCDGGQDCEWQHASTSYDAQWYMAAAGE